MAAEDVSFQLRIDAGAKRVVQDGQAMVVRQWSEGRIVFSDFNPGILSAMAGGEVITLNRPTGAWRDQWGGGKCAAARGVAAP